MLNWLIIFSFVAVLLEYFYPTAHAWIFIASSSSQSFPSPDGWVEQAHRGSDTVRVGGLPVAIAIADLYVGILPG